MQVPLQITVRDMPRSDALEARIWEKAAELERFHSRITSRGVPPATSHLWLAIRCVDATRGSSRGELVVSMSECGANPSVEPACRGRPARPCPARSRRGARPGDVLNAFGGRLRALRL